MQCVCVGVCVCVCVCLCLTLYCTSGRSTGAHLHLAVLVAGTPQDPARFLAAGPGTPPRVEGSPTVSKSRRR